MNNWHIEVYFKPPIDRWSKMSGFSYLSKSFASGAWAMLKAFYNKDTEYRLLRGDEVMETEGKRTVKLS